MTGSEMRFDTLMLALSAWKVENISKSFANQSLPAYFDQAEGDVPDSLVELSGSLRQLGNAFTALCSETAKQILLAARQLESTDQAIGKDF